MSLRTFVKISGVTNLSDARYCAGMGVDMLGFAIDPSLPNSLSPEAFKSIAEWIAGVTMVGEIHTPTSDFLHNHVSQYAIQCVQVQQFNEIQSTDNQPLPFILSIRWDAHEPEAIFQQMKAYQSQIAYFLLESDQVSLTTTDQMHLQAMAKQYPILLGFGIEKETILDLLQEIPLAGIALRGGQEIRPGYKDYDELAAILELLEND